MNDIPFLQRETAAGVTIVAVDGPVSEIRRTVYHLTGHNWFARNRDVFEFTIGYGLLPILPPAMKQKSKKKGAAGELIQHQQDHELDQDGELDRTDPVSVLHWYGDQAEQDRAVEMEEGDLPKRPITLILYDASSLFKSGVGIHVTSMLVKLSDANSVPSRQNYMIILAGPGIHHDLPVDLADNVTKLTLPPPPPILREYAIDGTYNASNRDLPDADLKKRLINEGAGLTMQQFYDALRGSLVVAGEDGHAKPGDIRKSVQYMLTGIPGVSLLETDALSFEDMHGYDYFKQACASLVRAYEHKPLSTPKGFLLYGIAGTGKSYGPQCAAGEFGWKCLLVSLADLKDKYVGESEKNFSKVMKLAEALAPVMVVFDEVDKLFGGSEGQQETSGVQGSMLQQFLSWQAERKGAPVLTFATCNRMDVLPPEFSRDGRFNKRMWFGPPDPAGRRALWAYYMAKFQLPEQSTPEDENWTGAEIRACCEDAYIEDCTLHEAAVRIVPVHERMGTDAYRDLLRFAKASCVAADTGLRVGSTSGNPRPEFPFNSMKGVPSIPLPPPGAVRG